MKLKQLDIFGENEENPRIRPFRLEDLNVIDLSTSFLKGRLRIQKNGNYKGLCIFHTEKTPSFYLRHNENRYICYGCGEEGGPYSLLLKLTKYRPFPYLEREFDFNANSPDEIHNLIQVVSRERDILGHDKLLGIFISDLDKLLGR